MLQLELEQFGLWLLVLTKFLAIDFLFPRQATISDALLLFTFNFRLNANLLILFFCGECFNCLLIKLFTCFLLART